MNLTKGPEQFDSSELNDKILAIAVPAIVANITTPLLGLVDLAIIGKVGGEEYLAAVGVGSSLFSMVYMLFAFLRMGTAGLTAQSYGAFDRSGCSAILRRALITAGVCSIILLILVKPLGPFVLDYLDADNASAPLAWEYITIVIFGAPAALGMFVLNGWLLGMQNTKLPMRIAISINCINVAASFYLAYVLDMKIAGIAYGTLISQWIGFIACLIAVKVRYKPPHVKRSVVFNSNEILRLLKINIDIFLRNLCLIAVTMTFTRAGSLQNDTILAANTLLMQFFFFFSYFSDGFAYAAEALAGMFTGAGEHKKLRQIVGRVLNWGMSIAVAFTIIYFAIGDYVIRIITDDARIVFAAREYTPWMLSVPLCGFAAFIFDGVFIGITRTRDMLLSVALGTVIFLCIYFITRSSLGNHGVWLAFICYLATRGLSLMIIFRNFSHEE